MGRGSIKGQEPPDLDDLYDERDRFNQPGFDSIDEFNRKRRLAEKKKKQKLVISIIAAILAICIIIVIVKGVLGSKKPQAVFVPDSTVETKKTEEKTTESIITDEFTEATTDGTVLITEETTTEEITTEAETEAFAQSVNLDPNSYCAVTSRGETPVYYTINEVRNALIDFCKNGEGTKMHFNTDGLTTEDLHDINMDSDPTYGVSSKYTYDVTGTNQYYVTLTIDRTVSAYVYQNVLYGRDYPSDMAEAKAVGDEIKKILSKVDASMSDYDKELLFHDYLIDACVYSHGPESDDHEYDAYGVLVQNEAVCEGYATTMHLLLDICNIENRYITGVAGGGPHAWNLVKIDGSWYNLDVTWDDPLGEEQCHYFTYFNLSDEVMRKDHDYDQYSDISCDSMDANYFARKGLYFNTADEGKAEIVKMLDNNQDTVMFATKEHLDGNDMQFIYDRGILRYSYLDFGHEGYYVFGLTVFY